MESRRTFLKKASLLAGATAACQLLPESIQRALAIDAPEGSTYLDAEHVVFLMQENRSFDHCYGTLRGVRGFNDPRAIRLPNGLPVWAQTDAQGKSYAPFHLDIENTKATWMGSLPHGWKDMVHARNDGRLDTWLEAKRAGNPEYRDMPLTMGYYDRRDIPFYYAFADAFTVCDQHFCSSLTGTSANRSYFWAGAIREEPHNPDSVAHVDNGQINYKEVGWKTYPERLQEAGIAWKVYQNELSLPIGLSDDEEDWLANFTDNNLEFYKQYHVRFHPAHHAFMVRRAAELEATLGRDEAEEAEREKLQEQLTQLRRDIQQYSGENFSKLTPFEQELHRRAFVTNTGDSDYHRLEPITYTDEEGEKTVEVPKGDIFYQFRKDVNEGKLPTVSWLVAPCRFSDHPGSPWYGAWYVSETLDILTKNPEVWKKTIFILTYDENDGYFDHVPPFVPPLKGRDGAGAMAIGIDTAEEYVTAAQEKIRTGNPETTLDSPIGLGFRVPLVVASPWTKGGWVNSEVFDHTSALQFLEHFIERKTGKQVCESNISAWRRLVCGNLTSVFRPAQGQDKGALQPIDRNAYVERIYSAKTKGLPGNYRLLQPDELTSLKQDSHSGLLPWQEVGTKPACSLPYDATADAVVDTKTGELILSFALGGGLPKTKTMGIPFIAVTRLPYRDDPTPGRNWNFAIREGEALEYRWSLADFKGEAYYLEIYGPNGFYREFKGKSTLSAHRLEVSVKSERQALVVEAIFPRGEALEIQDLSYGRASRAVSSKERIQLEIPLTDSDGWYDFEFRAKGYPGLSYRYAGHVETGRPSITDPLMGGVIQAGK